MKEHDTEKRKVLVAYEDGDEERMTVSQLKHFLVPDAPQQSPDRRKAPPAAAPQPRSAPQSLRKYAAPAPTEVPLSASGPLAPVLVADSAPANAPAAVPQPRVAPAALRQPAVPPSQMKVLLVAAEPLAPDKAPDSTPTAAQAAATIASWAPGEPGAVADAGAGEPQPPPQPSNGDASLENPAPTAAEGKPAVQVPSAQQQTARATTQEQQPAAQPVPVPQLPPAGSLPASNGLSQGAPEQLRDVACAPAAERIDGGPAGVDRSQRDARAPTLNGTGTAARWLEDTGLRYFA